MPTPGESVDRAVPLGSSGDLLASGPFRQPSELKCLLCGGVNHRTVFNEFGIDVVRCAACGHVFSSFQADPHYAGFWGSDVAPGEHYYWSKARAKMHRDFFIRFVEGRSGRLLDMGSGLGFFLKAMEFYRDWEAYGCEISPAAVKYAREQLGLQKVLCSPLQFADLPRDSFDVITMWDVIDHIPCPDPLLSHCHALLKRDGVLFLRTPNVAVQLPRARLMKAVFGVQQGRKYLQGTDHPHHYSARSIATVLGRNGFKDIALLHLHPVKTGVGWKGTFVNLAKGACFQALRALAVCTGGRLNYNNLFLVARKGVRPRSA